MVSSGGSASNHDEPSSQPHVTKPALTYASALKDLDSTHWNVRARAMTFLMAAGPSKLPDVLNLLRHAKNPEQANRLFLIARQLYLRGLIPLILGPRAFLGVRYWMEPMRAVYKGHARRMQAVVIVDILPGFPATAKLRRGEDIVGMDGRLFPVSMRVRDFRTRIAAFKPGTCVSLLVKRGDKITSVAVRLAGMPAGASQLAAVLQQRRLLAQGFAAAYGGQ